MGTIENNICEAIQIIVNKAVAEASYDKTIQATISSCEDSATGKYKIKYQNSSFYAYSTDIDTTYSSGTSVYVLVPGNDMSKTKTIIGTVDKLGTSYITALEEDESYEVYGSNCVDPSEVFRMSSYHKDAYTKVLYSKDNDREDNEISIDTIGFAEYIKNADALLCGASFRTGLATDQQSRGNYGIVFALDFYENGSDDVITRYYTVDVDKMTGNPYKLVSSTRQYGIFDIDSENFIEINYISIFAYDFPNSKPESECVEDIFVKSIELSAVQKISDEDLSNYSLTITTPQGLIFSADDLESAQRTLQGTVKIKGKELNADSSLLSYYWFVEHSGISSSSQYYNSFGGQGWKCLNEYNILAEATEEEAAIIEWVPATYQYIVTKEAVPAKSATYKCVAVYDGNIISKTVTITNMGSLYDLTIESSTGTQFYYDIGQTDLKCLVNGESINDYTYSWSVTSNAGSFQSLAETADTNEQYDYYIEEYNNLLKQIANEEVAEVEVADELAELKTTIDSYSTVTMIKGNNIYNLLAKDIVTFSTYKCTVYNGEKYLGTASLVIVNSLETSGNYSLVINNGTYSYKYDENGVSPASRSLTNPISIQALTFTIYDNLGNEITNPKFTSNSDIQWIVPNSNTMLEIDSGYVPTVTEDDNDIYTNLTSLSYNIANRYSINKTRNNIKLKINYKGMSLSATTNFTFVKEGEPGTNGTEYICKIVPNVPSGYESPAYPMVTEFADGSWSLNYTTVNANKFFRVQLWHSGELILDSATTATSTEGKEAKITWSMLQNKYTYSVSDATCLSVTEDGTFNYEGYSYECPADIAKATVVHNGVTYYAMIPIIVMKVIDDNYRAVLKKDTGFRYAVYTSDGQSPKYDSTYPFEVTVTRELSDGNWEDVSTKTSDEYKVDYSWNIMGMLYGGDDWYDSIHLVQRSGVEVAANQHSVRPLESFDGNCVSNAIECIVSKNDMILVRLHMPVHLYIDRTGNANLNAWDGNSVQISEDGGFILAPQIGAGVKNSDNSFTGIVMGEVKETNETSAEIGLFGYASGKRSFFLDADTGTATFGIDKQGQIIIDPSNNKAQIKSGNYSTSDKTGLMIDLTTPEIRFGSGNFIVDKDGNMTAISGKFSGDISGATGTFSGGLNIGNGTFTVDENGNMTAKKGTFSGSLSGANITGATGTFSGSLSGANITGGTITIGENFSVNSSGIANMIGATLNNLTVYNSITAASDEPDYPTKDLFSYDSRGRTILTALDGNFEYLGATGIYLSSHTGTYGGNVYGVYSDANYTSGPFYDNVGIASCGWVKAYCSGMGYVTSSVITSTVPTEEIYNNNTGSTTAAPSVAACSTMVANLKNWVRNNFKQS